MNYSKINIGNNEKMKKMKKNNLRQTCLKNKKNSVMENLLISKKLTCKSTSSLPQISKINDLSQYIIKKLKIYKLFHKFLFY